MADPNEPATPEPNSETELAGGSKGPPKGEESPKGQDPGRDPSGSEPERAKDRNRRIREQAAEKRRAKREAESRRVAPARNLDASEIVDDALIRSTHKVVGWVKRHFNVLQWVLILGVVVGIGWLVYKVRRDRSLDQAGEELNRALAAERARVGPPESAGPDRYTGLSDPRREFPTDQARLAAAEAEYRKAQAATKGVASELATLGLAGILYDRGQYKEAQAAYEKVKDGELAKRDRDALGRAIEGIGLSFEAQGQAESALRAFRELSNSDIPGLNDLGKYHQARILVAQGEREKARDLLRKLVEKLGNAEQKDKSGQIFLERQAQELLAVVDPSAKLGAQGITPEQLERIKQQLKLRGQTGLDEKGLEEALRNLKLPSSPSTGAPTAPGAPHPSPSGSTP